LRQLRNQQHLYLDACRKPQSHRDMAVLAGLCAGQAKKEIARDRDLREPTIKLHVKLICRKLGARNRTQAAMIAREPALC
jgi:DNA-binding NarL/FixJ family response regulator